MSSLRAEHGTATVELDATAETTAAMSLRAVYDCEDLLNATAAVLRAARDSRADQVQGMVRQ